VNGKHIEAKDLPEMMDTEEKLRVACENLKTYLEIAQTFDGRETTIEY
jgi:hypothetical protein